MPRAREVINADADKKNWFDIEKYLKHRLKLKSSDHYELVEVQE